MNGVLEEIFAELERVAGLDVRGYRSNTLLRRLSARMGKLGIGDPLTYLRKLRGDPAEAALLIDVIGVSVSHFFRDPFVFEILAESVLPQIIEEKERRGLREIRVWSAGCAGGEEAYSVAILLHRALQKMAGSWQTHVFASDISGRALRNAASGIYPRESFKDTKLGILDEYFEKSGAGFSARPFLRAMVHFCCDDLLSPGRTAPSESIFGTFDMVLCRNVLIYFEHRFQTRILEKLRNALGSSGVLVLGPSESIPAPLAGGFVALDREHRIWRKGS